MARKIFAVAPDGSIVSSTTDSPYVCMRLFQDGEKWRRASAHGTWERGRKAQEARPSGTVLVAVIDSKEEAQTLAGLAKAQSDQVQSTKQGDTQPPAKREENDSMATEASTQEAPAAEVIELNPTAGDGQNASKRSTRSGSRSTAKSGSAKKATSKKATSKKATSKKASAKKASAKKATAAPAATRSTGKRMSFPVLKTEAACERVMKANLAGYKQYQVERDKNRNEAGMETHREAYKTYKNAYAQLLAHRKAAGKGRRNQKDAS